jgi:hypothetical protein
MDSNAHRFSGSTDMPRLAPLPMLHRSEDLDPSVSQTIIGVGVRDVDSTPWSDPESARTLVHVRAAVQEPAPARQPSSTLRYGTHCAGLGPGPVSARAQGSALAPLSQTPAREREVFQLARRIALQADLPAAMRVLHHGLSRLADSPDVMCVFFDTALHSAWAVPDRGAPCVLDAQVHQLVTWVARSGQRVVLGHALVEPIGPAPARAVLLLRRPPTSAMYGELEIATVAAIAAALVGLVGHFVADHVARHEQAQRHARSPSRPGATVAPGCVVPTARTWMRWAYPTLIGLVAAAIAAAATIQVPTYSTGVSILNISPSAELSVVALLPGHDRPRLEAGMTLQLELSGHHQREQAVIDAIDSQVIGPDEARKRLGDPIGDALPFTGPAVIVRAHLTARTSAAGGRADELHDGMLGKVEVKVDHQSLLRVLLHGKGR